MMGSRSKIKKFRAEIPEDTPWKLRTLAKYLDDLDRERSVRGSSVQDDLRSLADSVEGMLA